MLPGPGDGAGVRMNNLFEPIFSLTTPVGG